MVGMRIALFLGMQSCDKSKYIGQDCSIIMNQETISIIRRIFKTFDDTLQARKWGNDEHSLLLACRCAQSEDKSPQALFNIISAIGCNASAFRQRLEKGKDVPEDLKLKAGVKTYGTRDVKFWCELREDLEAHKVMDES